MKEVIVFTSPTCAPCKQMKPFLESQAELRGFPIRYIEMSIGNQALFTKYQIRTVPTVVCMGDSEEEIGRFNGGKPPQVIEDFFNKWGL